MNPLLWAALGEKAAKAPATQAQRLLSGRSDGSAPGRALTPVGRASSAAMHWQTPTSPGAGGGRSKLPGNLESWFPPPPRVSCLQTFQGKAGSGQMVPAESCQ